MTQIAYNEVKSGLTTVMSLQLADFQGFLLSEWVHKSQLDEGDQAI